MAYEDRLKNPDLSKIKAGDVVANYPAMCKLLGVEKIKGNGKPHDRQIENWKRFFTFKREGHKFVIGEIYEIEKPKEEDKRKQGNHSLYTPFTSALLLNKLAAYADIYFGNGNYSKYFTKKELMLIIGLCNESFTDDCEIFFSELYKRKESTEFNKNNFYSRAYSKISQIIDSTINNLVNTNKIVSKKDIYVIVENSGFGGRNKTREATEGEEQSIKEIEKAVLDEMGCKASELFGKRKEYYTKINKMVKEVYKWESCYRAIQITIEPKSFFEQNNYELSDEIRDLYLSKVNKEIHQYLDKKAKDNFDKQEKKPKINNAKPSEESSEDLEPTEKRRFNKPPSFSASEMSTTLPFKYPNHYVERQLYLSKLLIVLEGYDIEEQNIEDKNQEDQDIPF